MKWKKLGVILLLGVVVLSGLVHMWQFHRGKLETSGDGNNFPTEELLIPYEGKNFGKIFLILPWSLLEAQLEFAVYGAGINMSICGK